MAVVRLGRGHNYRQGLQSPTGMAMVLKNSVYIWKMFAVQWDIWGNNHPRINSLIRQIHPQTRTGYEMSS
jgi:hypothetical protein